MLKWIICSYWSYTILFNWNSQTYSRPTFLQNNYFKEDFLKRLLWKVVTWCSYTEPHSPWQSRGKLVKGEIKQYTCQSMQHIWTLIRLLWFCYKYSEDLLLLYATKRFGLQGYTSIKFATTYAPNISEYASVIWFQWCWYFNEQRKRKIFFQWFGNTNTIGQ